MFSFISPRSTLLGVGLLALTSAAVGIPRIVRSRRAAGASAAQKSAQKKSAAHSQKKHASRRKSKNGRAQKQASAS